MADPDSTASDRLQRATDIVLAGLALLGLSPVFLAVMAVLRVTGEGLVFFPQQRYGRHQVPFTFLKFRTMVSDAQNRGTATITLADDPRILPVGKVLRRTKLDELPQLINVVRGDMSLIGPRPLPWRCFAQLPAETRRDILRVRPGISGLGAVVFRGEDRILGTGPDAAERHDKLLMPYKGALEQWYVRHRSYRLYGLLIALTLWSLVASPARPLWRLLPGLPEPPAELAPYIGPQAA